MHPLALSGLPVTRKMNLLHLATLARPLRNTGKRSREGESITDCFFGKCDFAWAKEGAARHDNAGVCIPFRQPLLLVSLRAAQLCWR